MRVAVALNFAGLLALAVAACAAPAETPQAPAASPTPTVAAGYAGILGRNGIDVPSRGKFVLVNIPAFELIAFEDGNAVLRSRVIVGRPATPTPQLVAPMHAVTFNPSWTPTPAMMRYEGLRHMPPGPNNPLGQILFELDNDELIFLHDTNDHSLFERPQRALSHGCVRVQQARALAAWALATSETEVAAMVQGRTTHSIPIPAPIPVSLVYHTRFPDEAGHVASYPDIYGRQEAARLRARTAEAPRSGGCHGPL